VVGIVSSNVRANIVEAFRLAGIPDISEILDVFCGARVFLCVALAWGCLNRDNCVWAGLDNAPSKDKGETLAAIVKKHNFDRCVLLMILKHACRF